MARGLHHRARKSSRQPSPGRPVPTRPTSPWSSSVRSRDRVQHLVRIRHDAVGSGRARDPKCDPPSAAGAVLALRAADHRRHDRFADAERDACDAIEVVLRPDNFFSSLPWGVLLQVYAYSGHVEKFVARHEEFLSAVRGHGDDYDIAFSMSLVAVNLMALGRAERRPRPCRRSNDHRRARGRPVSDRIAASALGERPSTRSPTGSIARRGVSCERGSIGADLGVSIALGMLGRIAKNAEDPRWATQFRGVLDRTYDTGPTRAFCSRNSTTTRRPSSRSAASSRQRALRNRRALRPASLEPGIDHPPRSATSRFHHCAHHRPRHPTRGRRLEPRHCRRRRSRPPRTRSCHQRDPERRRMSARAELVQNANQSGVAIWAHPRT